MLIIFKLTTELCSLTRICMTVDVIMSHLVSFDTFTISFWRSTQNHSQFDGKKYPVLTDCGHMGSFLSFPQEAVVPHEYEWGNESVINGSGTTYRSHRLTVTKWLTTFVSDLVVWLLWFDICTEYLCFMSYCTKLLVTPMLTWLHWGTSLKGNSIKEDKNIYH